MASVRTGYVEPGLATVEELAVVAVDVTEVEAAGTGVVKQAGEADAAVAFAHFVEYVAAWLDQLVGQDVALKECQDHVDLCDLELMLVAAYRTDDLAAAVVAVAAAVVVVAGD